MIPNPVEKPVIPADIIARLCEAPGIAHTFEFRDVANRPYPLAPWGEPIREIFA